MKIEDVPAGQMKYADGSFWDPLAPTVEMYRDLRPHAHAMGATARWGGHHPYMLLLTRHCLWVAAILRSWGCDPMTQLWGLLHDVAEAGLGDHPRPRKGRTWVEVSVETFDRIEDCGLRIAKWSWADIQKPTESSVLVRIADLETLHLYCLAEAQGLVWPVPEAVWAADDICLGAEWDEWDEWDVWDELLPGRLNPWIWMTPSGVVERLGVNLYNQCSMSIERSLKEIIVGEAMLRDLRQPATEGAFWLDAVERMRGEMVEATTKGTQCGLDGLNGPGAGMRGAENAQEQGGGA